MRFSVCVSACALLAATATANATPYVVTLEQIGSDVVAAGSGEIDLNGLAYIGPVIGSAVIFRLLAGIQTGPTVLTSQDGYGHPSSWSGPSSSNSSYTIANVGSGDEVGINTNAFLIYVPSGYVSGNPLSNSTTYDDATFATVGVTPGTYVWVWGPDAEQSFTVEIGTTPGASVPAPIVGTGLSGMIAVLLGSGLLGWWRRRQNTYPLNGRQQVSPP